MYAEQLNIELSALKARILAIEAFLNREHPGWDATPPTNGTAGTISVPLDTTPPAPVEDVVMHDTPASPVGQWVVPTGNYANIRQRARYQSDAIGKLLHVLPRQIIGMEQEVDSTGMAWTWYQIGPSEYVRSDVVRVSEKKPAPLSQWPTPLTGYTITNRHHNERHHEGVDLAAPIGTPVFSAPVAGYVTKVFTCIPCGPNPLYQRIDGTENPSTGFGLGNHVVVRYIEHPAENQGHFLYVLFAHLSKIDVQQGQLLTPSRKIGEVGTSGNSSGPHLHLQARYSDRSDADFYGIRANELDPSLIFGI